MGNVWEFLGGFFGGIYLEVFLKDFLGGILWEEFFGKNYLVEIKKEFMFLSRFWGNARRRKEGQEI